MGNSWQTEDQKAFFNEHLPSFTRSSDEGSLKKFWLMVTKEWFECWPVSEPSPEFIEEKGTVEKARKALKTRKTEVSIAQSCSFSTLTYSSTADKAHLQE